MIVPKRIQKRLQTDVIGKELHHYDKVTSTNDIAKELAIKGAVEGTVVIAGAQTQGRGRFDRRWLSPRGGLWFSIILRPDVHPADALKLTSTVAVAVARTIRETLKLDAEIKWPNDVLIKGKKVCGILTEMNTKGDVVNFVTLGIGINVNVNATSFSETLRTPVTSLKEELEREVELESFLCTLLEEVERYYGMFTRKEFDPILEEWKSLTSVLDSRVEVVSESEKIIGRAVDVDREGFLFVQTENGTIRKVTSGDLTLLE